MCFAGSNLTQWGLGILVQLAMLAALRSWMNLDYLLATGVAVEIAVIHNFLWHERFTWADRPAAGLTQSAIRLIKFNATNGAVSLAVNLLVMRVFVGAFRANYVVANLFAIAVCSLLNFVLGDRFASKPLTPKVMCHFGGYAAIKTGIYSFSCYALEWIHFAFAGLLDRGTRLPAGIFPFCLRTCAPTFSAATNSLHPIAPLICRGLHGFSS